ncbi:MAG TPA: hypothetical protein VK204_04300 [Nocardioidaceae bacterium]|jgi:methyl-accepting chemotaxis protein|nr:hypothetical protein [Nocardioidaceae bacterium]
MSPRDHISKAEIRKDALQDTVEATATAVGTVTNIVTTAVRDLARAVGGFATEVFEIRESARRAAADAETSAEMSEAPPGEEPPPQTD